ncbi:MAG: hypothetical protein ACK57G_05810 [Planctomycetota bacterium]|jgi:hypothetical protein
MISSQGSGPGEVLEKYFAGLSEYTFFTQLGVADTQLVQYISKLLVRFTKTDAMLRIRKLNGRPATEVVTMMTEAQQRIGLAKREVHRHIGDFTLFWTGLYPESLRSLQGANRSDQFVSYCQQGKLAYEIASEIEDEANEEAPSELLHRLSRQFDLCAYGLREVRRQWEEGVSDSGPILI